MELISVGYDEARVLTKALNDELRARYDDEGETHADAAQFLAPGGVFYVAVDGGTWLGCGGLRTIEPGVGEIKRMYVVPEARGRGVSRVVLAGLVEFGRAAGLEQLVLETGPKQHEAIGLYESSGFTPVEAYGEWVGEGGCSLFYGLALR